MAAIPRTFVYPFSQEYRLTQGYGVSGWPGHVGRADESEFPGHNYDHWHSGIDIGAPYGTTILAAGAGSVLFAGVDTTGYGNKTLIDHGGGIITLYGHQSSQSVTAGQTVAQGQPIGAVGSTGNSGGPHLHFGVFTNGLSYGTDVDPGLALSGNLAPGSAPPGPIIPRQLPHSDAGGTAANNTTTVPSIPVGPELPTESMALRKVRPFASSLTSLDPDRQQPIMACDLDGVLLPVVAGNVQMTTFKTPGSYKVTLPLSLVGAISGGSILDRLTSRRRTQVTLYAAYVQSVLDAQAGDLLPIFTGFCEVPHFSYSNGPPLLDLSGPDMSGLLSTPSATESNLQQFANMTASEVAAKLAARHNLDTSIDAATDHIGSYYDSNTLKTRRAGQTEFDILSQLAINQGFIFYVDGTTLRFGRLPDPIPTLVTLRYQVAGEPAGPVVDLQVDAAPHSRRDYAVVIQSYDTRSKAGTHGKAGTSKAATDAAGPFSALYGANQSNVDSLMVVTRTEPPNTPQKALDAKAASILALYQSTEYVLTATIKGCLPLYRFSEVVIISDTVYRGFTTKTSPTPTFYVASISYDYTTGGGMTQTITATNRPYGVQGDVSAPATGLF